jgi:SAM-dependent methyltransferase
MSTLIAQTSAFNAIILGDQTSPAYNDNFAAEHVMGTGDMSVDSIYTAGEYFENNPSWHDHDAPWKARQIAKLIADKALHPKTICEVGCGTGQILIELAKNCPSTKYVGYDISPQAYELWRRKNDSSVDYRLRDIFDGSAEHFDLMLIIDVIEHVEDVFGFLRGIRGLSDLKIFHIPLDLSVQSILRSTPIARLRESVGHIHYYTKDLALSTLKDCGYEILDFRYTASRLELPNQARSSRLMVLPRRLLFRLHPGLTVRVVGGYSLLVLAR